MPRITYIHPDGRTQTIEAVHEASVMRTALRNGVSGIIGECGGQAMCATCHIYVPNADDLPAPSEEEYEMLECTAAERTHESRLGCQLHAGIDFEDIQVHLPERQV